LNTEVDSIWNYVFVNKLSIKFDKNKVLSFTGNLPREITLFASLIGSEIDFRFVLNKYLSSSVEYYLKRIEKK